MAYADMLRERAQHDPETKSEMKIFRYLQIVLAVCLPPLAVFLERGCSASFLVCVALSCIVWLPGVIFALYIVLTYESSLTTDALLAPSTRTVQKRTPANHTPSMHHEDDNSFASSEDEDEKSLRRSSAAMSMGSRKRAADFV